MRIVKIKLFSPLPVVKVLEYVENLLENEKIIYTKNSNSIATTKTPMPFISVDWRIYTRKNWAGINPFVFVSKVWIQVEESNTESGGSNIEILVDTKRSWVVYAFVVANAFFAGISIPDWSAGLLVSALSAVIFYIILIRFPLYIIKNEVNRTIAP